MELQRIIVLVLILNNGLIVFLEAQDPCPTSPCRNNGICANSICHCATGYLGDKCQIDMTLVSETLERHNEYRKYHNVEPLTHNLDISIIAQKWADYIKVSGTLKHSEIFWRIYDGKFTGESLAFELTFPASTEPYDGKSATSLWYNEILNYNYNTPGFSPDTGRFTNVVWAESKEIGIGRTQMPNGAWVIVAHYHPMGNLGVKTDYERNVKPYDRPQDSDCPLLTNNADLTSNLFNVRRASYNIDLSEITRRTWGVAVQRNSSQIIVQHKKSAENYIVVKLCFWVRKILSVQVELLKDDLSTVNLLENFKYIPSIKFKKHCLSTIPSIGMTAHAIKFTITPFKFVPTMFFRYMDVRACTKPE